jgi:hypothetical protein
VAPYLTLMKKDAPQCEHSLRELFNALCWRVRRSAVAHAAQRFSAVAWRCSAVPALECPQAVSRRWWATCEPSSDLLRDFSLRQCIQVDSMTALNAI